MADEAKMCSSSITGNEISIQRIGLHRADCPQRILCLHSRNYSKYESLGTGVVLCGERHIVRVRLASAHMNNGQHQDQGSLHFDHVISYM